MFHSTSIHFSILSLFFLLGTMELAAQSCPAITLQEEGEIASQCGSLTMTMLHDREDRDYLYVAAKSAGLWVYDISNPALPVRVSELPIDSLGSLHVMNLSQQGSHLYLALGNHFSGGENPGLAIVNVSDPTSVWVEDVWISNEPKGGAGEVVADGDYAFLAAMEHGLIIFDISQKDSIAWISQFVPDISYPDPNPDPAKFNARGLVVKGEVVYLCYDAGGLRIINVADKLNPRETGWYSNPALISRPRAYNNLVVKDTLVYIAVDYCGLEVLSIADTSQIKLVGWWNPWNCQSNPLNWFSSPGHTNEIELDTVQELIFVSTGKSDMYAIDVSQPSQPDSCFNYGGVSNGIATWGIDVYQNQIFLSYICSIIPFSSNWTGVKMLSYEAVNTGLDQPDVAALSLYPNPSQDHVQLRWESTPGQARLVQLRVYGERGDLHFRATYPHYLRQIDLSVEDWPSGLYFFHLQAGNQQATQRLLKP